MIKYSYPIVPNLTLIPNFPIMVKAPFKVTTAKEFNYFEHATRSPKEHRNTRTEETV